MRCQNYSRCENKVEGAGRFCPPCQTEYTAQLKSERVEIKARMGELNKCPTCGQLASWHDRTNVRQSGWYTNCECWRIGEGTLASWGAQQRGEE